MPNFDGNPNNQGDYEHRYIPETTIDQILKYYASARVVGCSMRA